VNFSEAHQFVTAHVMKCYRRSAIQLHSFITSVLDGGVRSISRSSRFTPPPRGKNPGTHCTEGWAAIRAGMDGFQNDKKSSSPSGIRTPDRPAVTYLSGKPIYFEKALHAIAHIIPPLIFIYCTNKFPAVNCYCASCRTDLIYLLYCTLLSHATKYLVSAITS